MSGSVRSIVVVSPFNAYPGVSHAGGEYLLRHLRVLAETMAVTLITPDPSGGDDPSDLPWDVHCLGGAAGHLRRAADRCRKLLLGGALPYSVGRALAADQEARRIVRTADAIDFQWTESASLDRVLRRINPTAPRSLLMHDVLSQRWLRAARQARRWWLRPGLFARLVTAWLSEKRALRRVRVVGVFSEKDAQELRRWHRRVPRLEIVRPSLLEPGMTSVATSRPDDVLRVLFTAAFARPENEEGALWLLRYVWPRVAAQAGAQLILAGASPSARLLRAIPPSDVTVTDYVPSLAPYYRSAHVFVAPVLRGAGVKFKVISAMLWGVPVVATQVAAEGVGEPGHYLAVTSDPTAFAEAILHALSNADARHSVAECARAWAQTRYGDGAFRASLARYLSP